MSARFGFSDLAGTAPDAAAALPIGSQIEAHSVLQVLSEGPNGFVYLTRDAAHGATRVLKEFMPRSRLLRLSDGSVRPCDVSDSIAMSVARIAFMNEANTLAAFQHPALIQVLGVIPANRTLYRVMPLVDGVSLEQHCRTRAEAPSLAWLHGLVEGLLQALQVLHERRLGHGSVRPSQVMVRESGLPLLLGFASVARELDAVSPTPWQSPGAAHLTRHALPAPGDDLPALAETAYFAATGLQAPSAQQRLEGVPFDLRQVLGALPNGPGDTQQRRRGLLSALEGAFATSTHARPQSVAEFRRLLAGDAPTRGGRYEPAPRWVGEMPERDVIEVDLLISQPAPLSDDLLPRDAERPFEIEPTVEPVAAVDPVAPALAPELAVAAAPEHRAEPVSRSTVERDFAATEFLVASAEPAELHTTFPMSVPDSGPFVASLRPQPPRRVRSPYAAMAALSVLALVGVGIAGWWYSDAGQVGPANSVSPQGPALIAAPVETLPAAAAVPQQALPAPAPPEATVAATPPAPPTPAMSEATPSRAATLAPPPLAALRTPEGPVAPPPPQTASGTTQQRTAAAAAARTEKPATARASAANVRPPAPMNAGASRALQPRSPLAACGSRTLFSLVYCMQQQCAQAAYRSHPQCADVRTGG